jgi:hypothetical protein
MSVVLTWTSTEERGKPNDLESVCSLICRVLFFDAAHHRPGTSWHVGICKHWWQSNAQQTLSSSSYERESEKNRFSSEVKASVSHHELRTERMPPLDPNAQRSAVVVVVVVVATKNLLDPNNEQNRWRERPERKGRPTPPRSKPHKRRGETACEYEQGTWSGRPRHGVHAVGEDKRGGRVLWSRTTRCCGELSSRHINSYSTVAF